MDTKCLHCGASFYGRTDKKFCDDHCRSTYHNALNSEFSNMMRYTHRRLRKNWKILTFHFKKGEYTLPYQKLHKEGFMIDLMTGIVRENDRVIYKCYEHLYELSDDGCIHLVGIDVERQLK